MGGNSTYTDSWEIHIDQICPTQTFATCYASNVGEFCDVSGEKTCQEYIRLDPDSDYCDCPRGDFSYEALSENCKESLNDYVYRNYCNSSIIYSCEKTRTPSAQNSTLGPPTRSVYFSKLQDLVTTVNAQEEIILSPTNGLYSISTSGRYCTDVAGVGYCFELENGRQYDLYIDNNENNILDEGDILLEDEGVSLRLEEKYSLEYLNITSGLNLIHLDRISEDYTTAFEFISYLNTNFQRVFFTCSF